MVKTFFGISTKLRNPRKLSRMIVNAGGMIVALKRGSFNTRKRVAEGWQKILKAEVSTFSDTHLLENNILVEEVGGTWFVGVSTIVKGPSGFPYPFAQEFGLKSPTTVIFENPLGFSSKPDVRNWANRHPKAIRSNKGWKFIVVGGPNTHLGTRNAFFTNTASRRQELMRVELDKFRKDEIEKRLKKFGK